jgi:hypothetical protein
MKRFFLALVCAVILAVLPTMGLAYDINDSVPDAIGTPTYETYGMNVVNWTPGVNGGNIQFNLFSNYAGVDTVLGSPPWTTTLADLFITENYFGVDYQWAIPLASRPGFTAGTMYAVGTALTSTDVYNANGGGAYTFNPNINVQIATIGNNYGWTSIGGGSVASFGPDASMPYYQYQVTTGIYEDDPFATMTFLWGTATCANDILTGQVGGGGNPNVPIPPTALLLGSSLLGLVGLKKWKKGALAA